MELNELYEKDNTSKERTESTNYYLSSIDRVQLAYRSQKVLEMK